MLAATAGLSVQTIHNVENRRVWPHDGTVRRIAVALQVPYASLWQAHAEDTWQAHLTKLGQQRLGAHWVEEDGKFVIDPTGSDSDNEAAQTPLVQQLHSGVIEKARLFAEMSKRLDNTFGWNGIAAAAQRFFDGVRPPTKEIPDHLGSIYNAILELGSFLEQDLKLQRGTRSSSSADPLDAEVHRGLSDLVRTAAPWLRQFPTIRELDDESAAFLTKSELLKPGAALIAAARDQAVVSNDNATEIVALIDAARRGEVLAIKAKNRGISSIRNLLYVSAATISSFLVGATASSFAEHSSIVKNAGAFIGHAEDVVTEFVAGLPTDLRTAFQELIKEIKKRPDMMQ